MTMTEHFPRFRYHRFSFAETDVEIGEKILNNFVRDGWELNEIRVLYGKGRFGILLAKKIFTVAGREDGDMVGMSQMKASYRIRRGSIGYGGNLQLMNDMGGDGFKFLQKVHGDGSWEGEPLTLLIFSKEYAIGNLLLEENPEGEPSQ